MTRTTLFDSIVLADSYVLEIRKAGSDIVFHMELMLDDGWAGIGYIVFRDAEAEYWQTATGEPVSLERLNEVSHRYYGGSDEQPDLGTINSAVFDGNRWAVVGDWGEGRFLAKNPPEIVLK